MGTRTVRLDDESERILAEVRKAKKLTVSAALKEGLVALSDSLASDEPAQTPYSIYRTIDLGGGGRSRTAARNAKSTIQAILRRKTRR